MYQTSEEVATAILGYSRTWRIRLEEVGGDIIIGGDEITEANSEHESTSTPDDIQLGAVCSQYWTVKTSYNADFVGKKFKLYFYLLDLSGGDTTWGDLEAYTGAELSRMTVKDIKDLHKIINNEYIPMGEFTCVKAPRTGDGRELHLYDKLYFTDKPYLPQINLPALASEVEQDICAQLGIGSGEETEVGGFVEVIASRYHRTPGLLQAFEGGLIFAAPFDFTIEEIPAGATMREMLGYIAAIHGQFGCIDRFGRYTRRWYAPQSLATIDRDHADEPTVSETENRVVGIRCNTGDEELTVGSMTGGRVLELEDPFMTGTLIRALFTQMRKMSWYTSQLCERLGDPRHDIGDTVTIMSGEQQYDIPITMIQFSFDGGLLADISAAGLTEEEQSI